MYAIGVATELGLALVTFIALFFIVAPYGRHARAGWGPVLPNRLAWVLMEAPSALIFFAWFVTGTQRTPQAFALLALWELHYVHRAFVFPWRLRPGKPMPAAVMGMGIAFNVLNASVNGYAVSRLPQPSWAWIAVGGAVFVAGWWTNL